MKEPCIFAIKVDIFATEFIPFYYICSEIDSDLTCLLSAPIFSINLFYNSFTFHYELPLNP